MASTVIPPQRPFDEADFKRRLADEYKILQDKIDKIGAFRFTIKGWSVTAVLAASAALAAGGADKSLLTIAAVSSGLCVMVFFFFRLELKEVKLSRLFGDRARRLEEGFRRIDQARKQITKVPFPVPYTAQEIVHAAKSRSGSTWETKFRVCRQADLFFYLALMVLAFAVPLVPRYKAVYGHVKPLWNKVHQPADKPTPPTGIRPC